MRRYAPRLAPVAVLVLSSLAFAQAQAGQEPAQERPVVPGGELQILAPGGALQGSCPLKHTDVVANVAGFVNRTRVKQSFHNPRAEKIEAVYVFPLPSDAAVDEMVRTVGDRRVVGTVKKREEARQVYEQAKAAGNVAGTTAADSPADRNWPHYGNEPGGSRHSRLVDIRPDNVAQLELAWSYRTGDTETSLQVTPVSCVL